MQKPKLEITHVGKLHPSFKLAWCEADDATYNRCWQAKRFFMTWMRGTKCPVCGCEINGDEPAWSNTVTYDLYHDSCVIVTNEVTDET